MSDENSIAGERINGETINGIPVKWFDGNAYVKLGEYETLLYELQAELQGMTKELAELKALLNGI